MDQSVQSSLSRLLIILGVIPVSATIAVALSQQPEGDVIDQSDYQECDQYEPKEQRIRARINMVAEQHKFKGVSRAQTNAVRLNVKDFLPQKFKGDRGQLKAWADEVTLFLSIEGPRLTNILKRLQTTRQPITDMLCKV
eukprot:4698325-Amphidinium_carterae.1